MHLLAPLAALLGIEVDALVERMKRSAVAYTAMALFALVAIAFLLVAAYVALGDQVGPLWSALIIAGAALVVVAGIFFWSRAVENARHRRVIEKRRTTDTTALITTAALTALPMLIRNSKLRLAAVPIGAVLGYMLLARTKGKDHADD